MSRRNFLTNVFDLDTIEFSLPTVLKRNSLEGYKYFLLREPRRFLHRFITNVSSVIDVEVETYLTMLTYFIDWNN